MIDQPENIEDDWELLRGISRLEGWPDTVQFRMNVDFPKDLGLADNLHVYGAGLAVISDRLRAEIERAQPSNIEFLPVEIINHKGRSASDAYFLLNPVGVVDCIDLEASGVVWNPLNEEAIFSCEGLVLDEGSIPEDRVVFRPKHWPAEILVRSEFASELEAGSYTGISFGPTEGYTGIG